MYSYNDCSSVKDVLNNVCEIITDDNLPENVKKDVMFCISSEVLGCEGNLSDFSYINQQFRFIRRFKNLIYGGVRVG